MFFRHALVVGLVLAGSTLAGAAWAVDDGKDTPQEQPIRVSYADKAACLPDALRYCREHVPNLREVLYCFDRNRDKISTRCRTALAGHGLQ